MTANDRQTKEPPAPRFAWVKPTLMGLVLVGACVAIYASPLRNYLLQMREHKQHLQELGAAGLVLYMLAVFVLVAAGCPRLLFCPIGGMAFGLGLGLLWTQIPTLLGYYASFLFVRWGGREFALHHWPKLDQATQRLQRQSWLAVFLIRQVPLPGVVVNLFLGLSPVRHGSYLLGTALGLLPQAIPATLVGKSLLHVSAWQGSMILGGAVVLFLLFFLGLRRYADSIPWLHSLREILGKRQTGTPPGR